MEKSVLPSFDGKAIRRDASYSRIARCSAELSARLEEVASNHGIEAAFSQSCALSSSPAAKPPSCARSDLPSPCWERKSRILRAWNSEDVTDALNSLMAAGFVESIPYYEQVQLAEMPVTAFEINPAYVHEL